MAEKPVTIAGMIFWINEFESEGKGWIAFINFLRREMKRGNINREQYNLAGKLYEIGYRRKRIGITPIGDRVGDRGSCPPLLIVGAWSKLVDLLAIKQVAFLPHTPHHNNLNDRFLTLDYFWTNYDRFQRCSLWIP